MWITFTQDCRVDSEDGEPHYKAGYQVDVNQTFAMSMIKAGNAVMGKIAVETPAEEPVTEEAKEPEEEPKAKPRGRRNRSFS